MVVECIEVMKTDVENNEEKITRTDIVEKAVLHYYASVYGEKALTDIIFNEKGER